VAGGGVAPAPPAIEPQLPQVGFDRDEGSCSTDEAGTPFRLEESERFDFITGGRAVPNVAYCVATLTSADVSRIAKEVKSLPENFESLSWLEQNFESIATLAAAAIRDIVIEALEIGLSDHPLILCAQRNQPAKTVH
jgi:hypothetical protein